MKNYTLRVTILLIAALAAGGCSKNHEAGKTENVPVIVVKGVALETVKNAAMPELLDVVGSVRARAKARGAILLEEEPMQHVALGELLPSVQ